MGLGGRQVAISNSKQGEKENENLMTSMRIRRKRTKMLLLFREWVDGRIFSCYGQTENLMFTPNSCTLMNLYNFINYHQIIEKYEEHTHQFLSTQQEFANNCFKLMLDS